jgi:hypothetical protein
MSFFDKFKKIKYDKSFEYFYYQFYIYDSLFKFLGYRILPQSDNSDKVYLIHPRKRHLRVRFHTGGDGHFDRSIDDLLYNIIYRNYEKVFFDEWFDGSSESRNKVRSSVYYDIKPELEKRFTDRKYRLSINELRMILLKCEVNLHKHYFQEKFHILANDNQKYDYCYYQLTRTFQRLLSMEKPILSEHDVIENSYDNKIEVIKMIDIIKELIKLLGQNQNNKSWQRESYSFFSVPDEYIFSQNRYASKIVKPIDNIIECNYCFQKNRIPKASSLIKPKCAKCENYLINFEKLSMLEFIIKLKSVETNVNSYRIQNLIDYCCEEAVGYPYDYKVIIKDIVVYNKNFSSRLMRLIQNEYKKIKFIDNFPLIVGHDRDSDFITLKLY